MKITHAGTVTIPPNGDIIATGFTFNAENGAVNDAEIARLIAWWTLERMVDGIKTFELSRSLRPFNGIQIMGKEGQS